MDVLEQIRAFPGDVGFYFRRLDGAEQPLEAICRLEGGESAVWELSLPLTDGESGALCRTLELTVSAYGESGEFLFSLPVQIELNR